LALANGARTVSEIAKTLNWDEYKILKTVYQLVRTGLLERGEAQRRVKKRWVGENFFLTIENELRKIMGAVAPFVIEDELVDFGETKDSLPQDQALSFIESLGEEIPNAQKAKEFVRAMREFLSLGK
jgi:hypothetical protein